VLLKLAIQYLRDFKTRYNVERIVLQDNSFFKCRNDKNISLAIMYTLLYGTTWYGKYGFRPYDESKKGLDEELYVAYKNNIKIVTTKKIKHTIMFEIMYELYKTNMSEEEALRKKKKYREKYGDLTIDKFFRVFLKNFENSCLIFDQFYRTFCTKEKIQKFDTHKFYLML
jgi:hypothetical protein